MVPKIHNTRIDIDKGTGYSYFEEIIKPVERKTVAVEMESFGVARACEFANDGITVIPLLVCQPVFPSYGVGQGYFDALSFGAGLV